MERFYVWQDAYIEAGYAELPEFDLLGTRLVDTLGGPQSGHRHSRGRRWAFREWDMPGLQWAVQVDGTINDSSDTDRGWTAEIAFPWEGLKHLADGRSLPAREGDIWRMDFSRFQWIEEGGARVCPGWAWTSHGTYDSHIPDRFSVIHFSAKVVGEGMSDKTVRYICHRTEDAIDVDGHLQRGSLGLGHCALRALGITPDGGRFSILGWPCCGMIEYICTWASGWKIAMCAVRRGRIRWSVRQDNNVGGAPRRSGSVLRTGGQSAGRDLGDVPHLEGSLSARWALRRAGV